MAAFQKQKTSTLLLWVCMAGFLLCGGIVLRDLVRGYQEKEAVRKLTEQVRQAQQLPERYTSSGHLSKYDLLYQQNSDFAGWLSIPGTEIDYPVMYTPDQPEYYLRRAFDKSASVSGSLFLGENTPPEGDHLVIYGHNMKNGAMLSPLLSYADEAFAREHMEILFDTLTEEGRWQLLGAFYLDLDQPEENGPSILGSRYTTLSDQEIFEEYICKVQQLSLYQTGTQAQFGDRILTLTTCSYHVSNGRFVAVAVQQP